jgi:two-component system chemotaxis response regulator CheB
MIKVFIIDDSMLIRNSIKKILSKAENIIIIGEANNPIDAFKEFKKTGLPDVFLLDIEMPKMDGLTFLRKLKEQKPIPTIICSSITQKGSPKAIEALGLGAIDIIVKSSIGKLEDNIDLEEEFISKIEIAYNSINIDNIENKQKRISQPLKKTNKIVAIGSSTGGVQTLEKILLELQPNHSPIVITQHMPAGFTHSFSARLNKLSPNSYIKEARDGDKLLSGQILIAPGDKHLEIKNEGMNRYKAILKDYPKVSNHKPSVDVLFTSLAKEVKENSVAIILTGMGRDGAIGIKKVKIAGGLTFGQDEATSVVYGMPKVAFEMGGIDKQIPLDEVATIINKLL